MSTGPSTLPPWVVTLFLNSTTNDQLSRHLNTECWEIEGRTVTCRWVHGKNSVKERLLHCPLSYGTHLCGFSELSELFLVYYGNPNPKLNHVESVSLAAFLSTCFWPLLRIVLQKGPKGIRNLKGNKSCRLACTQTLFYFSFRSFRRHRSINPLRFIFYHARSTDFEKKKRVWRRHIHNKISYMKYLPLTLAKTDRLTVMKAQ